MVGGGPYLFYSSMGEKVVKQTIKSNSYIYCEITIVVLTLPAASVWEVGQTAISSQLTLGAR